MRYIYIVILFICGNIYAQDPIFSQGFLVPETLNSSFAGATQSTKMGVLHRSQWTSFGFKVNTNFAFIDAWFPAINSGIGISILSHSENKTKYSFNEVKLNYSLALQITEDWFFRPSISAGVGIKDYGFQNLILEDQININTGAINTGSIDPILLNDNKLFFDVSSSLLFNNENSWIGLTLKHLNKPNISMTGEGNVPLDIFLSLHSNIKIPLNGITNSYFSDRNSIYFLSNFMMQSSYSRFDIGSQYVYDNTFSLGFLVTTNPLKKDVNKQFLTSITAFAGLKWEGFKFGYSYDANTSKIGVTGGIHELSILYDFPINLSYLNRFKCVKYF